MKLHLLRIIIMAIMLAAPLAWGQDQALPPGKSVLADDILTRMELRGEQKQLAVSQPVDVAGEKFTRVLRLTVQAGSTADWNVQLVGSLLQPIQKDDVLLLRLRARCVESMTAEGQVGIVLEENRPPHQKLADRRLSFGTRWTDLFVPFKAARDLPVDQAQLCLRVGFDGQTIELADVQLINFGPDVNLDTLPRTHVTYIGREPDAQWRKDALDRIEKIRKGDLKIVVSDASGKPVANAKVRARLKRQAFGFGSCVTAELLTAESDDARRYREIVGDYFNMVVFENDMKWPAVYGGIPPRLDRAVEWLADRQIEIRGHNLVWPSWRWLPAQVREHESNPAELARITNQHITDVVSHFKGKLSEWDVVNEPFSNHELIDLLGGRQVMVEWFKLAHQADPDCRLYLNDYGILEGGRTNAHREHFHQTIQFLRESGAPLHGVGIQSHFSADLPALPQVLSVLDRFGEFSLPIVSTELSLNVDDPQLQADYLRDYMIALYSHPNVRGIMLWGFWQKRHWRPQGALWTDDWTIRPHGQAWVDLVDKQWRTDVELTTDAQGIATTRGFLGDYEIVVTAGSKTATVPGKLDAPGQSIAVTVR